MMRTFLSFLVVGSLLSGCASEEDVFTAAAKQPAAKMTPAQGNYFVSAVLNTPPSKLEVDLPKKLSSLGVFSLSFNMYELASAAYELVLENPSDMSRWKVVAKLDSFDTGVFAPGYQAARAEALRRNPNLFNNCPSFPQWSAQYHQELRSSG